MGRDAGRVLSAVLLLSTTSCAGGADVPDGPTRSRCIGEPTAPPRDPDVRNGCRSSPEAIQAAVRSRMGRYRACYERVLATDRDARGRIAMRFHFPADGVVRGVCAEGGGAFATEAFLDCMNDAFVTLRFPPHACEGSTTVTYPLILSPE